MEERLLRAIRRQEGRSLLLSTLQITYGEGVKEVLSSLVDQGRLNSYIIPGGNIVYEAPTKGDRKRTPKEETQKRRQALTQLVKKGNE